MKAVRAGDGGVAVVDVEEPPGSGGLVDISATSVCASDLGYVAMGFDKILGHELAGFREGDYDVVIEAAGTKASLDRAIELVAPRGTIVVPGVHLGTVELDWMPLFHREARVIPSLGYCGHEGGREMEDAAAMVADDPDIARALITHRFPIEDAAEAFRVAGDRSAGAIRVVIEP